MIIPTSNPKEEVYELMNKKGVGSQWAAQDGYKS
jgi:hypothetical protein